MEKDRGKIKEMVKLEKYNANLNKVTRNPVRKNGLCAHRLQIFPNPCARQPLLRTNSPENQLSAFLMCKMGWEKCV